jgi:hypothetical protein
LTLPDTHTNTTKAQRDRYRDTETQRQRQRHIKLTGYEHHNKIAQQTAHTHTLALVVCAAAVHTAGGGEEQREVPTAGYLYDRLRESHLHRHESCQRCGIVSRAVVLCGV